MTTPSFTHLGLSDEMTQALAQINYSEPTPIQYEAIPVLMEGKDIIGQAATGTGKTAAFAIPIIEKIIIDKRQIQAVVVCPTRELAIQVADEFRKFSQFKAGLTVVSVYGGQPMERQRMALHKRPQILIATPGRMLDFLRRGAFHLNSVQTVVLDEADEMLNMGFRDDIESIFEYIPTPRQTVLFSATMPDPILRLTRQYQENPVRISIKANADEQVLISQFFMMVNQIPKPKMLTQLIDEKELKSSIVFCNTKRQVDFLVDHLNLEGYDVEGLHGGKTQGQRERILTRFRKGYVKVLVATDVAARGIDVRNIQAVVNYDLPEDAENYTHRIGRTGRAGQEGYAFCLVSRTQARLFNFIQKEQRNAIQQYVLAGDVAAPLPQGGFMGDERPRPRYQGGRSQGGGSGRPQQDRNRGGSSGGFSRSNDAGRPDSRGPARQNDGPRSYNRPDSAPRSPRPEGKSFERNAEPVGAPRRDFNAYSDKPKKFDKPFGKSPRREPATPGNQNPERPNLGRPARSAERSEYTGENQTSRPARKFDNNKPFDKPFKRDGAKPFSKRSDSNNGSKKSGPGNKSAGNGEGGEFSPSSSSDRKPKSYAKPFSKKADARPLSKKPSDKSGKPAFKAGKSDGPRSAGSRPGKPKVSTKVFT